MRPHQLKMKAFGPFAKETVIDFDAMGNNIYLISGDTGSGKTTIFDGIIYALYGTASGGARSGLGTEAFHSDYAKEGKHREELQVEMDFSNAGRRFTVMRRMYWGKKGDSKTVSKESSLSENGNTIVYGKGREDKDEVTLKITEILGLDADQFRRIIMLAQGEFQKFLTAKSDERGVILGKLYDNRRHQDFQLRLKAAANLLKEQDRAAVEQAKAQLNLFAFPDDIGEEERAAVSVDHPMLMPTMQKILAGMDTELERIQTRILVKEKIQSNLNAQKTKGETCNKLLGDLKQKEEERLALDSKAARMDALKRLVSRAECADKVLPAESAMLKAAADKKTITDRICSLEAQREQLEEQLSVFNQQAEQISEVNAEKIVELKAKASEIQNILHFYDDLAVSRTERDRKEKSLVVIKKNVIKAAKTLEEGRQRQRNLTKQLQRLDSAGEAMVSMAGKALKEWTDRQAELEKLQVAVAAVQTLTEDLEELTAVLNSARQDEICTEAEHLRLNNAFIQGQAGFLAENLREMLENQPEVICPVCGSMHTEKDIPQFACLNADIPSRKMVDAALKAWEKARKATRIAEENYNEKAKDIDLQKHAVLEKAKKLILLSSWEDLCTGQAAAEAIEVGKTELLTRQQAYNQAAADKAAKEKAQKEKIRLDDQIAEYEKKLAEAVEKQNSAANELTVAETNVKNWEKQLRDFPADRIEAEEAMSEFQHEAEKLQAEIDTVKDACVKCRHRQAANNASLESAYSAKIDKESAAVQAEDYFSDRLKVYAFEDANAYHKALSPEGKMMNADQLAAWLKNKQSEVNGYDQSCRDLDAAIKQLKKSTSDMEWCDISVIDEQLSEISQTLKALQMQDKRLSAAKQTNLSVSHEISKIQNHRGKYKKAFGKLNPLAETADGKYAFSRYVLTGFFHRIVDRANLHLETMTDGEYCLVPKETGDGRSNVGLELKVLNTITNAERDTGSLSGGQLFEASLSLALGLSEVVQMESTGSIQIDSMFIDEGFGSLDGGRLDKSIDVLRRLSSGRRQIGIISHVARLDECLPKKIHVIPGEKGSSVTIETDA